MAAAKAIDKHDMAAIPPGWAYDVTRQVEPMPVIAAADNQTSEKNNRIRQKNISAAAAPRVMA